MLYTITFISKQQLRDIKLEKLFNENFNTEKYIHTGLLDCSVKVKQRGYFEVWDKGYYGYRNRSMQRLTKWKTIRGAETSLKKLIETINSGEKRRILTRGNKSSESLTSEYIPIICDITSIWNTYIESQIENEKKSHQNKLNRLISKLAK